MDPEADNPLRVVIPDLVPDPEFVGLLAARAAASRGSTMPPPLAFPGLGVRVAAAAAGVVLVITGAAFAAATLAGDDSAPAPTVPASSPTVGDEPSGGQPPANAAPPARSVGRGGPPTGTLDDGRTSNDPGPSSAPSGSPTSDAWLERCEEWLAWADEQGYDVDDVDCEQLRDQYRDRDRDRDRGGRDYNRHNDDWDGSPR